MFCFDSTQILIFVISSTLGALAFRKDLDLGIKVAFFYIAGQLISLLHPATDALLGRESKNHFCCFHSFNMTVSLLLHGGLLIMFSTKSPDTAYVIIAGCLGVGVQLCRIGWNCCKPYCCNQEYNNPYHRFY